MPKNLPHPFSRRGGDPPFFTPWAKTAPKMRQHKDSQLSFLQQKKSAFRMCSSPISHYFWASPHIHVPPIMQQNSAPKNWVSSFLLPHTSIILFGRQIDIFGQGRNFRTSFLGRIFGCSWRQWSSIVVKRELHGDDMCFKLWACWLFSLLLPNRRVLLVMIAFYVAVCSNMRGFVAQNREWVVNHVWTELWYWRYIMILYSWKDSTFFRPWWGYK